MKRIMSKILQKKIIFLLYFLANTKKINSKTFEADIKQKQKKKPLENISNRRSS